MPIETARACRDLISGAKLVELDSGIHLIWLSDVIDEITTEIESFVRQAVDSGRDPPGYASQVTVPGISITNTNATS